MEEAASTTTAFKIIEEEDLVAEVDFVAVELDAANYKMFQYPKKLCF